MIRARLTYWSFRFVILLARPFPLRTGYAVATVVAMICYRFFGRQRRCLRANVAQVLGTNDPARVEPVAREAFRNFGRYVIDFIHFPVTTVEEVRQRLVFDLWDQLNAAYHAGKGVVIITLHFGNWDMGAASLAAFDYTTNALADTFGYPPMNELIVGSRAKLGMRIIPRERLGSQPLRVLHRGEILAVLIDVGTVDRKETVEYFGAPVQVSSGPARLARAAGACIIPAVVLREPARPEAVHPLFGPTIWPDPALDEERDVHRMTQATMTSLEELVRPHPEQWFIFHDLWQQGCAEQDTNPLLATR